MSGSPDEIAAIVAALGLQPHPEGGFFAETYRSDERIAIDRYGAERTVSTAIYFMVTAESPSRVHRVRSDEIWHVYAGDPLEMLQLHPDGRGERIALGTRIAKGERPQVVVPRGVWQGVRVQPGGRFGLVGATVAPGFDFADFEMGAREELRSRFPSVAELIDALT